MNIFDLQATISLNSDGFMSGVQQAQTAFGGLGDAIKGNVIGKLAADAIEGAASGIVDFGKAAIDTGMSFGAAMSNVGAISGASVEDLERLRESAIEWGGSTKFSAEEVASAFSYMAMAGWDADQMLAGIGGVLNLAAASGEDLATTSDIVTDALTAFGMTAEDTGHFVDVLAATATSANTDVGMLGETFKYVAPLAGTAGYSAEDLGVAIGLMANNGIKASQAGTALRGALTKLVKPSDDAAAAMAELGLYDLAEGAENFQADLTQLTKEMRAVDEKTVALEKAQTKYNTAVEKYGENSPQAVDAMRALDKATYNLQVAEKKLQDGKDAQMRQQFEFNTLLTDSNGEMNSFAETVDVLRTAFSGLSKVEQEQYAATIFGQEAMSGMLAIINSSDADYDKLTDAVNTASDAMGGMGKAAEIAAQQQDNLNGDVVSLQSAMSTLQIRISEAFEKPFRAAVQTATEAVRQISAGISDGGIEGALAAIGDVISNNLGSAFENLMDKAGPLGDALSGISEAFQPFIDSISGAMAEALPVVVSALEGFFDAVKDVGSDALGPLATGAKDLISAFGSVGAEVIGDIASGISTFLDAFDNSGAADVIGTIASGAGDLLSAFGSATVDVVEGIASAVGSFMDAFDNETVAEIISPIAAGANDLFGAFGTVAADIISDVGENIGEFLDLFAESSVPDIIADIAKHAGDLFGHIQSAGAKIIEGVGDAIGGFLDAFNKDAAISLMEDVAGFIADLFAPFSDALGPAIEAAADGFKKLAEKFGDFAGELGNEIISKIRELVDDFDKWGPLVAGVAAGFGTMMIVTSVATGIKTLTTALKSGELAAKAMEIAQAALNAVMNANPLGIIIGLVAGLAAAFITAYQTNDEFREKVDQTFQKVKEAFEMIGQWLSEFFTSTIPEAFNKAIDWFKQLPEKFKEIGADIVNGIKNGFTQAWESFKESVSNLASGIVDSVKGLFGIHSPSRVFADIGENMVLGLERGWGAEFGGLESQVDRDVRRLTDTARIGFEDSAIGKSSAAGISSMFAASEGGGRGDPVSINLVLDGDVAATALYDPLRRTAFQRGQNSMEAAYA